MVSFRFYLVSVTAIFLALAVGITVGATVIDKATVDLLQSQIRTAKARAGNAERDNNNLKEAVQAGKDFDTNNAPLFVQGKLDLPILVTAVHGNPDDEKHVQELVNLFASAGARVQGVLWFNARFKLDKPEDAAALATLLELSPMSTPDVVRRTALSRLAATWAGSTTVASPLPALLSSQMAEFKPVAGKDAATMPANGKFVVAAPRDPVVPDDQVALPLVTEMVRNMSNRAIAVEAGQDEDPAAKTPAVREVFVGPLRTDATMAARVSTVDDIEDVRGRIIAVYAVQNMAAGVVGHYGVGDHAGNRLNLSAQP